MLKHGILGLLNYGEMTGYEIKEVFSKSLNYFWTAQTSQIYRELKALEKKNWAVSKTVMQTGKPDKKVFHITKEGKDELLQWLAYSDMGLTIRTPLLMKVFFLGERSVQENLEFFEGFQKEIEEYMQGMKQVKGQIELFSQMIDAKEKAAYWEMTLDFGRRSMKMHLEWAKACADRLKQLSS